MKHFVNAVLALVFIFNQVVAVPSAQTFAAAQPSPTPKPVSTATPAAGMGAYPPPVTPTAVPTAVPTAQARGSTPQPTLIPSTTFTPSATPTPNPTPTPKASPTPRPEVNLPIRLAQRVAAEGGSVTGLNGRLKMTFPADALAEAAYVWVTTPEDAQMPPTTLSGNPFQIVAKGSAKQQSIRKFAKAATIEISYDPQSVGGLENYQVLSYYDYPSEQWISLPSYVDAKNHLLIATTDHLTVFDVSTQSWQSARLPGVNAWQVAGFTGAATYEYPLALPEGPGGFKPSLSLSYNSQVVDGSTLGTQASWVGMGWSLETGAIERDMHGTPDYLGDDTFSLMIGGLQHRLLPYDSMYYHTMDETFWRARLENGIWTVWDKEGNIYWFEHQSIYQTYDSGEIRNQIWRWSLTKVRNRFDQDLLFTYKPDETKVVTFPGVTCDNQNGGLCRFNADVAVVPDTIIYPHQRYRIKFVTTARADYTADWASNNSMRVFFSRSKLSAVQVEQDSDGNGSYETLIKKWVFGYAGSNESHIFNGYTWTAGEKTLTLVKVEEYGLNGYGPLPATTFTYDADNLHLALANNGQGGSVNFTYQRIRLDETQVLPASTWDTTIPWQYCDYGWNFPPETNHECRNNPDRLDLSGEANKTLPMGLVRPGGAYSIKARFVWHRPGQQIGMGYLTRVDGVQTETILLSPAADANSMEMVTDLPANISGDHVKALIRCPDCSITGLTVGLVMTRYRVTSKVVNDGQTAARTYSYTYGDAHVNDPDRSAVINANATCKDADIYNDACYSEAYSEFRGHNWSAELGPDGRKIVTSYYQTDWLVGRAYRSEIQNSSGAVVYTRSEQNWLAPTASECTNVPTALQPVREGGTAYADLKICWVKLTEQTEQSFEGGAGWVGKKTSYTYDSALQGGTQYGNLTGTQEFAWNSSGYTPLRATLTRFYPSFNTAIYLVGLPAQSSSYTCPADGCSAYPAADLIASSEYLYDGSSAYTTPPTAGKLTGERSLLRFAGANFSDPRYTDRDYSYDTWGNRIGTTQYTQEGAAARATQTAQTTTTGFDATYHTYPTQQTNPAAQLTRWVVSGITGCDYDYALGVPKCEVDPNGAITWAAYDSFGRLQKIARSGDDLSAPTMQLAYFDSAIPFRTDATQKIDATQSLTVRKFYNGLGELIQTQTLQTLADNACSTDADTDPDVCASVVDQKSEYVSGVKKTSVTAPHWVLNPTGYVTPTGQTWQTATETSYDLLDRVVKVKAPDQPTDNLTQRFSYSLESGLQKTTATDPQGNVTQSWKDVWGRVVNVQPASGPILNYNYDAANRLSVVEQKNRTNNTVFATTRISYDVAGRKISMTDPDMGSSNPVTGLPDPNPGAWKYTYDANGNLIEQTDARGQHTCLYYDGLNRLIHKYYPAVGAACPVTNPTSYPVTYTYDSYTGLAYTATTNNPTGRRTGMTDPSGQTVWEYDVRGRVVKEVKTIKDGSLTVGTYTTAWTYNSADRVVSMTYPSGEVVTYTTLPQGTVSSLSSSYNLSYLTDAAIDAAGRPTALVFGNGTTTVYNYYPWTAQGGRLQSSYSGTPESIRTPANPTLVPTLQAFQYSYDGAGNITQIVQQLNSESTETINYAYDSLNRLDLVSGADSDDPVYDPITGNLTGKGGKTIGYGPQAATCPGGALTKIHAATTRGSGDSYCYDPNGNMVKRNVGGKNYTLSYDEENRLTAIGGELSVAYVYDGDGKRVLVKQTAGPNIGDKTIYIGSYFEIFIDANYVPPTVTAPNCGTGRHCVYIPLATDPWINPAASSGQIWKSYYYAGSARIAMRVQDQAGQNSSGVIWLYSDHLGSTTVAAKGMGMYGTATVMRYTAWGESRGGTTPTSFRYTGQRESEADLYFYNARFFDSSLGRFVSADSIIPEVYNSLDLDRFSYVRSNPVNFNDPTGHICNKDDVDCREISSYTPLPKQEKGSLTEQQRLKAEMDYAKTLSGTEIDSLKAFSMFMDFSASLYDSNDVNEFMHDMDCVINSYCLPISQGLPMIGANIGKGGGLQSDIFKGKGSWSDLYYDYTDSQMYHFWFYVGVSYFDTPTVAKNAVAFHDPPSSPWVTSQAKNGNSYQDYLLGIEGVDLGSLIRTGDVKINQVGSWVWKNLHETPPNTLLR